MQQFLWLGIYFILLILSLYTPIGFLFTPFLAFPFIIYTVRYTPRRAVFIGLVAMWISLFAGGITGLYLSILYISIGITMGLLYYLKKPAVFVILSGMGMFLFQTIFWLVLSQTFFQFSIFDIVEQQIKNMELDPNLMNQVGDLRETVVTQVEALIFVVKNMFVVIMIFAAAFVVLVNHWLSRRILTSRGDEIPGLPLFRDWRWPASILYYYFVAVFMAWLISRMPEWGNNPFVMSVLLNLIPLLTVIITLQGLSFIFWVVNLKRWRKIFPVVITILSMIFWPIPASFLLSLLGILDLGFNLRKKLLE